MDSKTINLEGKLLGYEKKTLALITVIILVAGVAFYVGAKYEKHKLISLGILGNKSSDKPKSNSIKGTITAQTDKDITIKMTDETTKVIEFLPGLTFGKTGNGAASDLYLGELVVITGEENADGKFIPTNIRISKKSPKRSEVGAEQKTSTEEATDETDASESDLGEDME